MIRQEAEELCREMNEAFARHDAHMKRALGVYTDLALKENDAGQVIKSKLMQAGWRLTCDKRGRFALHEFIGPMVVRT